jgi:Ni,Fe-hydrogenase maturation factor
VIFIDAADFGAAPGSIRLFELGGQRSAISGQQSATAHYSLLTTHCSLPTSVSTHSGGLDLSARYLREACRSFDGAEGKPVCELTCWLLAVQPGSVLDGRALSPAVREAADAIVSSEVWRSTQRT